jgi:filamentous hemagglutinin
LSGGISIGISTDGTLGGTSLFGQVQANGLVGTGIFAGVGIQGGGGATDGRLQSNSSIDPYAESNYALGAGMGASAIFNEDGSVASGSMYGKFFPGDGLGAMGAAGVAATTTGVTPTFAEMIGAVRKALNCRQ